MKTPLKLSIIALTLVLFNCNNESKTTIDYKFSDKESVINCNSDDSKLLNEALYAFEDDIAKHYDEKNQNLILAYNRFYKESVAKRISYDAIVSPHSMSVLEALQNNTDLFENGSINYKSDIFSCLSDNFKSNDLKRTFKALVETNSMSTKLFNAPLQPMVRTTKDDKNLALYLALDYYYKNIKDIDPNSVKEKPAATTNSAQETKKLTPVNQQEGHEGHNH